MGGGVAMTLARCAMGEWACYAVVEGGARGCGEWMNVVSSYVRSDVGGGGGGGVGG